MISRRNVLLCAICAAVCAAVVLSPAPRAIQVVFGVPFVLFLPGYALTSALFARRRIGSADVVLLSLAFSISIAIIGTLILNWLTLHLTRATWTGLLLAATIIAALWALRAIPADTDADRQPSPGPRMTLRQAVLLALALGAALVAVAAVIVFARTPLPARGVQGYTALWILPGSSRSEVVIGVQSNERHTTSYQLKIRSGGGRELDQRLTLAPGDRWTRRIRVAPSSRRVDAELFRSESPQDVYRRVRLLLGMPRPGAAS
jgi:uncharacterized membrane protein